MYAPGRDQRITGGDTPLEYETKGLLMLAFSRLQAAKQSSPELEAEVLRLEKVLRDETTRQVEEYERRNTRGS
jgi:hypothetical protein